MRVMPRREVFARPAPRFLVRAVTGRAATDLQSRTEVEVERFRCIRGQRQAVRTLLTDLQARHVRPVQVSLQTNENYGHGGTCRIEQHALPMLGLSVARGCLVFVADEGRRVVAALTGFATFGGISAGRRPIKLCTRSTRSTQRSASVSI